MSFRSIGSVRQLLVYWGSWIRPEHAREAGCSAKMTNLRHWRVEQNADGAFSSPDTRITNSYVVGWRSGVMMQAYGLPSLTVPACPPIRRERRSVCVGEQGLAGMAWPVQCASQRLPRSLWPWREPFGARFVGLRLQCRGDPMMVDPPGIVGGTDP